MDNTEARIIDQLVTAFLFACSSCIQAVGRFFWLVIGYGWLWKRDAGGGNRSLSGVIDPDGMEGFYAGLVLCPLILAGLVSSYAGNWPVFVLVAAAIGIPLTLYVVTGKNLFIPFFGTLVFFLFLASALLVRFSVIVSLFMLYLFVIFLAPLLLVLLLTLV